MVRRHRLFGVAGAAVGIASVVVAVLLVIGSRSATPRSDTPDLAEVVDRYVTATPGRGSGDYVPPSGATQRQMRAAWASMEAGEIDASAARLRREGYDVDRVVDRRSGRRLVVVSGLGGLFVHAPGGAPIVVEVPHPRSDRDTERLGVEMFLATGARTLLIAGAHRDAGEAGSADVARRSDSLFHQVHLVASPLSAVTVQLHGFASESAPGYDVIVSSGGPPSDAVRQLAARLGLEFRTCTWTPDLLDDCRRLGGTTNVQAQASRKAGTSFVHLELAPHLRGEAVGRRRIVSALVDALTPSA